MRYLDELKKLNLPSDKYAIFNSGTLAIRGLRENNDLDILVKNELWLKLLEKYDEFKTDVIAIGNIEAMRSLPYFDDFDKLIEDAEFIDNIPYVRLEYVLDWKKKANRPKDLKDVKLIMEYMNKSKQ